MSVRSVILAAGGLLGAGTAEAVTWYVTPDGSGDAPSIHAAVDSAAAGDTVVVACGTYFESGIDMKDGVVVTSETGQASCVTIDAQGIDRVFRCSGIDAFAGIVGFTITGGSAGLGGGILCQAGSFLRIENCDIVDNFAADGGGIYAVHSSPTISNCFIRHNVALAGGGGLGCYDNSHPAVDGTTFSSNTAVLGGAIFCFFFSSPALTDCTISGNSAESAGGAVHAVSSGIVFTSCVVSGNASDDRAGAFDFVDSSPSFVACTIAANRAVTDGGGIRGESSVMDLTDTILWGNCALDGSGLHLVDGGSIATLACCDVDTTAAWFGGSGAVIWGGANLFVDPLFCAPVACVDGPTDAGSYGLQEGSPCLEPGGACLAVIGAVGPTAACPGVSTVDQQDGPPGAPLPVGSYPSPFRTSTRVTFELPQELPVTLRVFDPAGRLVRTLEHRRLRGAGRHEIPWDGRDRFGARVAGGVYFYRLEAGHRRGVHRSVRLR